MIKKNEKFMKAELDEVTNMQAVPFFRVFRTKLGVSKLYYLYFYFFSCIGLIPYQISLNNRTHFYEVSKKSWIHKLICLLWQINVFAIWLLPLFYSGNLISRFDKGNDGSLISQSLDQFTVFIMRLKSFYAVHFIWSSSKTIVTLMNELKNVTDELEKLAEKISEKKIYVIAATVLMLIFLRIFWEGIFIADYVKNDQAWHESYFSRTYLVSKLREWLKGNLNVPMNSVTSEIEFSTLELIFAIFYKIGFAFFNVMDIYLDTLALMTCLIFKLIVYNFVNGLHSKQLIEDEEAVLNLLDSFSRLIELFNKTISKILLLNILITLPYFSVNFFYLVEGGRGIIFTLNIVSYFIIYFGIILLAADGNSHFKGVLTWFQYRSKIKNKNNLYNGINGNESERKSIMYIQLSTGNNFTIRGGSLFSVTYSFLGNALSFLITYGVIVLQQKNTKQ